MLRPLLSAVGLLVSAAALPAGESVTLYKTPGCACCEVYADYLRNNDFRVEVIPTHDLPGIKEKQGVSGELAGCHTALIAGYTFEGHIPVDSIRQVLVEQPGITGISVPGMPAGSPGMTGEFRESMRVWTIPSDSGQDPEIFRVYREADEWR